MQIFTAWTDSKNKFKQISRLQTCWYRCERVFDFFFFPVCVCACLPVSHRESIWVCDPSSWRQSLYLISAGSDWRSDSLPYLPDASLFPNTWWPYPHFSIAQQSPQALLWIQDSMMPGRQHRSWKKSSTFAEGSSLEWKFIWSHVIANVM